MLSIGALAPTLTSNAFVESSLERTIRPNIMEGSNIALATPIDQRRSVQGMFATSTLTLAQGAGFEDRAKWLRSSSGDAASPSLMARTDETEYSRFASSEPSHRTRSYEEQRARLWLRDDDIVQVEGVRATRQRRQRQHNVHACFT